MFLVSWLYGLRRQGEVFMCHRNEINGMELGRSCFLVILRSVLILGIMITLSPNLSDWTGLAHRPEKIK